VQEDIRDIQTRLQTGRFPNEASISQGIVMRLLSRLGWPIYDTSVVIPEFSLEGRRVDFALCHPHNKPIVFVEVKQPGETGTAERQLFEYAFHMGVPMVVLTTGQEWHFYLPAERGDYGERRVYGLDLVQRDVQESEHVLRRYLEYSEVTSGVAIENARHDYQNVARTREVRRSIPEAWQSLLSEPDELLLELLSDKTEAICGFRPDLDVVVAFLRRFHTNPEREIAHSAPLRPTANRTQTSEKSISSGYAPKFQTTSAIARSGPRGGTSIRGVTLLGNHYETRNGRDALQLVLSTLASRDRQFFERFVAIPKPGKRPYVARTPEELHPGRDDLADFVREIIPGSGWWMDVNLSTDAMTRVMRFACQASGLQFGTDLRIEIR
jgi:hypothetical protein